MSKSRIPVISIEQWAAFKAVVDEGSHAAAAEFLNKSQSTISYLLARLNEQLPAPALAVKGRKAELTELGALLYRHAAALLAQAQTCEAVAEFAASGWESELTIACDVLTPLSPVICALQQFSLQSPHTRVRILETSLSGTDEAIFNRDCDLAITARIPVGFLGNPLTAIKMIAVAGAQHELSKMQEVNETELAGHRQIVLRDTGIKREQNAGWLGADQRWTVSHFATSVEMVLLGLGFAFLPEHRVHEHIVNGTLKQLPLHKGRERIIPLNALLTSSAPGPGAIALMNAIEASFKSSAHGGHSTHQP